MNGPALRLAELAGQGFRRARPKRSQVIDRDRYQIFAWLWICAAVVAMLGDRELFALSFVTNAVITGGVACLLRHLGAIRLDNAKIILRDRGLGNVDPGDTVALRPSNRTTHTGTVTVRNKPLPLVDE